MDPKGQHVFIPDRNNNAILRYTIDPLNGSLSLADSSNVITLPQHIGIDPFGRFLYVYSANGRELYQVRIDPNDLSLSISAGPLVIPPPASVFTPGLPVTDPLGKYLFVSTGQDEQILIYRIDEKSGGLSQIGIEQFSSESPLFMETVSIPGKQG